MRVLVACEFSGVVRDAFRKRGHEAFSCDLLSTIGGSSPFHVQDDVLEHLEEGWDLMIAHPPCDRMLVSGALHWKKWRESGEQQNAIKFFLALKDAPIERIALENPVGIMSTVWREPDQYIQPWQFGHRETKKTGLWLKNLPKLRPTENVYEEMMKLPKRERGNEYITNLRG